MHIFCFETESKTRIDKERFLCPNCGGENGILVFFSDVLQKVPERPKISLSRTLFKCAGSRNTPEFYQKVEEVSTGTCTPYHCARKSDSFLVRCIYLFLELVPPELAKSFMSSIESAMKTRDRVCPKLFVDPYRELLIPSKSGSVQGVFLTEGIALFLVDAKKLF
ncbi:hypothetical protein [Brazilian marseillevirus]|uniref:hypothetical protein n=1 Tax=Brazilian marseillevirus TaxID=1813599 RepID=UPI0007839CDA|nr:hypothetical protein A3303_gp196 [Brazilian marseillevirus]AMQ10704.1 hypothetical protein [Brazilian marseillevirus]